MEYMPHLSFDADAVIHIADHEAQDAEPMAPPEDGVRSRDGGVSRRIRWGKDSM